MAHISGLLPIIGQYPQRCTMQLMFKSAIFCTLLLFLIYIEQVLSLPSLPGYDIWDDNGENFLNSSVRNQTDSVRDAKVLNFFPVPVEIECFSTDKRRLGTCLNTYECKIQGGKSHGPCALGFGVCCVFTNTCQEKVINNITYFVNPDFPDLTRGMTSCQLEVQKLDPEIAQLRLDFIHFTLGQPNRKTGVCEDDVFVVSGGSGNDLRICGINSGQHFYFDVENVNETIKINMALSRRTASRLWEIRVIQVPFTERAPAGCLQYHTGPKGIIQTMNFAENGRHLADQEYTICTRQEEGMCSITYEPCDENSFRIGPNNNGQSDQSDDELGSGNSGIEARSMEVCNDRITIPCADEDFLMSEGMETTYCSMVHCGNTLCPSGEEGPCKIESTVVPFEIGVRFAPAAREQLPDDNLGMCLTYEQLPCSR